MIDARKLKKILKNKSGFLEWIKVHICINNLEKNKDYFIEKIEINSLKNINKEKINYFLTKDSCAKIILSQSRNETAKRIKEDLENGKSLDTILKRTSEKKDFETKIISYEEKQYPEQLRTIKNPPKQLYLKGNIMNLKEYGIAVIGTRHCSNYGRQICKIFTNNLVGYNLNIISGLAIGIDACAHKACIEAKGKTIAVLPSGFSKVFPKENEELLNKILEKGGTIITEYPPEFEKTSESCRERNRIVSGLAIGTLVIEAQKRSGTSITVRNTNEQGKKAFCIPSSLLSSKGVGTNEMIKMNQAKLVTNVEDIIKEFPKLKLEKKLDFNFENIGETKEKGNKQKKTKISLKIEDENLEVYNFLTDGEKTIDEISQALNKPISEITYKLTLLELQGAIEELPGKKFKIK